MQMNLLPRLIRRSANGKKFIASVERECTLVRILLIDCSPEVTQVTNMLLGEKGTIESNQFKEGMPIDEFKMVFFELSDDKDLDAQKIKRLRYACNFRNVPIIIMRQGKDSTSDQTYLLAGGTEVLSLKDPPAACRQILQGYLTPGRQPLKEEKEYIMPFVDSTHKVLSKMAAALPWPLCKSRERISGSLRKNLRKTFPAVPTR